MGLVGLFRILRVGNAAMAAIGVGIGILATATPVRHPAWVYLAPASAFLITAFGNVLNDLTDQGVDRQAHPDRPLPLGQLSAAAARVLAWLLAAAGVGCVYVPGDASLAVFAAAVVALLLAYEARLKRHGLAGNLVVALLTAATFAFGAAATGTPPAALGALWVLVAMAFLTNLGREVVKDIEDFDADRHTRRTWPHRIGAPRAAGFAMAFVAMGVGVNAGWLAATGAWRTPLLALAGADLLLLGSMAVVRRQPGTTQRGLKLGMLVALVAYAVVGLQDALA